MDNKKDDVKTEDIKISDKKKSRNIDAHALKELFSTFLSKNGSW